MNKKYYLYRILRFIFTPLFKAYYHPVIIGNEKIVDGRLLLVGNHKHALDPLLVDICTNRVVHALAKSELFVGPLKYFFNSIGAIPVDLDAKSNPQAFHRAIDILNEDGIVNVSPEAARNYTEEILLPFKTGAVRMAMATNTRILPYCIVGDYKFNSKNLKIVFGDYLEFNDENVDEANQILFEKIKELLLKYK